MIEKKMVIVGNERLDIPVTNTYDSGVMVQIRFDGKDNCKIVLTTDSQTTIDITKDCKKIQILDHENYRRTKREYAFTVGKDVYWGIMARYQGQDKEKQFIQIAADMLNIPLEYESIKETGQKQ